MRRRDRDREMESEKERKKTEVEKVEKRGSKGKKESKRLCDYLSP